VTSTPVGRPDSALIGAHPSPVGAPRLQAPPPLDDAAQAAFIARSQRLAPQFRTELLPPPGRG
jgi:hypothetical protein